MKKQALFSLKDESKKLKCRLLQFLFGALRVKGKTLPYRVYPSWKNFVLQTKKNRNSEKLFLFVQLMESMENLDPCRLQQNVIELISMFGITLKRGKPCLIAK